MAGYSKKSLVEKLGIKEGSTIIIVNPPLGYDKTLGRLPQNVTRVKQLKSPLDFIHFFTKEKKKLEDLFPKLKKALASNGMLWVSWPKGSSRIPTDLNENVVRAIGLRNGLVDVKVCAIDERWSGLKFVYRAEDRK
ncbi:MAG: DUF3052 domain-containing protein [Ignavibacteriae bacterium]|nr:DUF3052 domain-containing protein [Ignavibacteriota bacterium]